MKRIFAKVLPCAALVSVLAAASVSFAGQEANFETCKRSDSSWMSRFGQYVVAFSYGDAVKACSQQPWGPHHVRQAGCYANGAWLKAGYYCEEISGG